MLLQVSDVLPLEQFSVPQKCLLPSDEFATAVPNAVAGSWAKCFLAAADSSPFALCQLYPRDLPAGHPHCYAATEVMGGPEPSGDAQLLVHRIECLDESAQRCEAAITRCRCEVVVNEQIFKRRRFQLAAISETLRAYLQQLTLIRGCRVRSQQLQDGGIQEVRLVEASTQSPSESVGDKLFTIAPETLVEIANVRLMSPAKTRTPLGPVSHLNKKGRLALRAFIESHRHRHQNASGWFGSGALVVGPAGVGKSTVVEEELHEQRCNIFRVRVANVLGQLPGETEAELRTIFENARKFKQEMQPNDPCVLYFDDLDLLCPRESQQATSSNEVSRRVCSQLLHLLDELHRQRTGLLCVATTNQPESVNEYLLRPGRFDREILIEPPSSEERVAIFTEMLPPTVASTSELKQLIATQTQGYVVADLELLAQKLLQALDGHPDGAVRALRQSLQQGKPAASQSTDVKVLKPLEGFQAIGGMEPLKRSLSVAILSGLKHSQAFERFGLSLPKGVLLYGPPGCAKTTFARCLAAEANMAFIATSGAEVYSPYVGCAERFVANIFNTARKNAPCLIFLDEIDALIGRRSMDARGSSDVQLRILSTLLTEMDGVLGGDRSSAADRHILVVAATNRPDMVDDALLRPGRFDRLIHVPVPDRASRLDILRLHQRRMPFAEDVDVAGLAEATHHYSGADLCNLCNEAAMQAFQRDCDACRIEQKDFAAVLRGMRSSLTESQIEWYEGFERKFVA